MLLLESNHNGLYSNRSNVFVHVVEFLVSGKGSFPDHPYHLDHLDHLDDLDTWSTWTPGAPGPPLPIEPL